MTILRSFSSKTFFKEDEIEDIVDEVKYTDSQKSIATTIAYSQDSTDSSSEKNNSSGKNTYVLECDSDDSDAAFHMQNKQSVVNITELKNKTVRLPNDKVNPVDRVLNTKVNDKTLLTTPNNIEVQHDEHIHNATSSSCKYSLVSQETFTQTSKTIIELAQSDSSDKSKAIETQTSKISFTENKTIEYKIQVSGSHTNFSRTEITKNPNEGIEDEPSQDDYIKNVHSLDIEPIALSNSDTDDSLMDNIITDKHSAEIINIVDERLESNTDEQIEIPNNVSEYEETSNFDSDNDSLIEDEYRDAKFDNRDDISDESIPRSVDNDVEELYNNLKKSLDLRMLDRPDEFDITRYVPLTPLTEESGAVKADSIADVMLSNVEVVSNEGTNKDGIILYKNNPEGQTNVLPKEDGRIEPFKLPPIYNQLCPSSPHLNSLFGNASKANRTSPLPSLFESQNRVGDRWEIGTKDLASGESANINGRNDTVRRRSEPCSLPSIYIEGHVNCFEGNTVYNSKNFKATVSSDLPHETISIQEKIKELKMSKCRVPRVPPKYGSTMTPESRSGSPGSASPDESRLCDAAERGCEALCNVVIKKLRTQTWTDVVEVLEELPKIMEKFWCVITEQRIADLIRQVSVHVDSPRTQVARTACNTLAAVLKNTNYTKKPDFYEAVTCLLVKTGSFSKPVRRAANVALDDIVCGVELTHAVTALCVHGISHKSPLVRCAAARLLVVCTALAGGGRDLLRARPATAAQARRNALRALSTLLDDKNTDTRKYAERLYYMLRPLTNFEAYYLTDVDVDLASKQMKKYDQLLLCNSPKESR